MGVQLAPPRGTIEYKLPEYMERQKFFNMYDSIGALSPFEPYEVVGYPSHTVELVKAEGTDEWKTAALDDELIHVVQGEVSVVFQENGKRVASATAVRGEVLLLPQGLEFQLSGSGSEPGLFMHFRMRGGQ
jgi:hypothetical protein